MLWRYYMKFMTTNHFARSYPITLVSVSFLILWSCTGTFFTQKALISSIFFSFYQSSLIFTLYLKKQVEKNCYVFQPPNELHFVIFFLPIASQKYSIFPSKVHFTSNSILKDCIVSVLYCVSLAWTLPFLCLCKCLFFYVLGTEMKAFVLSYILALLNQLINFILR